MKYLTIIILLFFIVSCENENFIPVPKNNFNFDINKVVCNQNQYWSVEKYYNTIEKKWYNKEAILKDSFQLCEVNHVFKFYNNYKGKIDSLSCKSDNMLNELSGVYNKIITNYGNDNDYHIRFDWYGNKDSIRIFNCKESYKFYDSVTNKYVFFDQISIQNLIFRNDTLIQKNHENEYYFTKK